MSSWRKSKRLLILEAVFLLLLLNYAVSYIGGFQNSSLVIHVSLALDGLIFLITMLIKK